MLEGAELEGRALKPPRIQSNALRSGVTWGISHGLARRMLLSQSRKGDLIAKLAMDPVMRADPFPGYRELRNLGTIAHGPLAHGTVDHAAVNQVLRSEQFGTAGGHAELPGPLQWLLARTFDPWSTGPVDPPSMLALDPPEHTRHRRLVSRAFTVRKITALEETVHRVAESLLEQLEVGPDRVDLVEEYAAQLPLAVIADMLGVPDEQRPQLLEWGNLAAVTLDPGLSWAQYRQAEDAIRRLHVWFDGHIERLRRDPGDDLLSSLAMMTGPDAPTEIELHAIGLLVLGAGFETTVNLIGNGVVQLDRNPDQRDLLRAEPERWGNAVEEVLRFDSPVQITLRQALTDTEVCGIPLRSGTSVLLFLGGANRDPAVFTDPERFDITRPDADQHVSFSSGVHYCLGASLARLEARASLQLLHERFPNLHVDAEPVRRGTRVLRGYEHIPVRLR